MQHTGQHPSPLLSGRGVMKARHRPSRRRLQKAKCCLVAASGRLFLFASFYRQRNLSVFILGKAHHPRRAFCLSNTPAILLLYVPTLYKVEWFQTFWVSAGSNDGEPSSIISGGAVGLRNVIMIRFSISKAASSTLFI